MYKNPLNDFLSKKNDFFIEKFSTILANTYLVYLKTQNYHWNIESNCFFMLHKFFEEQYQTLAKAVDKIAERIRALDGKAPGSFNDFLKLTTLSDSGPTPENDEDMLHNLLKDHILLASDLKTCLKIAVNYDDEASKDLFTERLIAHEKMIWMIKSHIKTINNVNSMNNMSNLS